MWRVLLILAPVIVYFAVDWSRFVKESVPIETFIVTSPSIGLYSHDGKTGRLGDILEGIQTEYPERPLAINLQFRFLSGTDISNVIAQAKKTIKEQDGVVSALSLMPNDQRSDIVRSVSSREACEALVFSKNDVREIIAQSPLVPGEAWHYEHVASPCSHDGKIEFQGQVREYKYYPTGYMSLEGFEGWLMCYDCSVYPDWIVFDGNDEVSTSKGAKLKDLRKHLVLQD